MVEVFIDMVPLAARAFVNRCRPGSTGSFEQTAVHKSLRGLAVYAGLSRKCAARQTASSCTLYLACRTKLNAAEAGCRHVLPLGNLCSA